MSKTPGPAEIRRVIEHLEDIGLQVYGPGVNLFNGQLEGGCMDFDAEQAIRFRELVRKSALKEIARRG